MQLSSFLDERPGQAGIVYALSRKRVDELAAKLAAAGWKAAAYHAGLGDAGRGRGQEGVLRDDLQGVGATVAFGMGIDKSNVRFVVHYDLPKNIESYYQETGRAGRDGLPAEALLAIGAVEGVGRWRRSWPSSATFIAGRMTRGTWPTVRREIDVWRGFSAWYGYEFFVMRAR